MLRRLAAQARRQAFPNHGPFILDDAVEHRISYAAVRENPVLAEHSFADRSKTFNRALGAQVVDVGFDLNADGLPVLKRVTKKQVLGLDVDASAPHVGVEPRSADFKTAIGLGDGVETCRADDVGALLVDDGERQRVALGLFRKKPIDVGFHGIPVIEPPGKELPYFWPGSGCREGVEMAGCQGDQLRPHSG